MNHAEELPAANSRVVAAQPEIPGSLSNSSEYASINRLEQYVRHWLFTPEYPDQALEEIKAKTPHGKEVFKSLSTSIEVQHRARDLRQACNNVLAQLSTQERHSLEIQINKPMLSLAEDLIPHSPAEPADVLDSTKAPFTPVASGSNPAHEVRGLLAPTVEVLESLTPDEESDRYRLELKVERAFYEAGSSLRQLRDRRLYRSTHKTFEEYCRERFGFTRQSANYLIAGSQVVENITLTTICYMYHNVHNACPVRVKSLCNFLQPCSQDLTL